MVRERTHREETITYNNRQYTIGVDYGYGLDGMVVAILDTKTKKILDYTHVERWQTVEFAKERLFNNLKNRKRKRKCKTCNDTGKVLVQVAHNTKSYFACDDCTAGGYTALTKGLQPRHMFPKYR